MIDGSLKALYCPKFASLSRLNGMFAFPIQGFLGGCAPLPINERWGLQVIIDEDDPAWVGINHDRELV